MTTGADVLRNAFAASCTSLDRILDGVSDEEFSGNRWRDAGPFTAGQKAAG